MMENLTAIGFMTVWGPNLSVYVGLGDGSPQQTQGFGGWEEVERPRRKSLTRWRGRQPMRITVPLLFDTLAEPTKGYALERDIRTLERLAGAGITESEPPVVQFESGGLIPHDFSDDPDTRWVIDGLEFGAGNEDVIRNMRGNRIRQTAVVTFLEYVEDKWLRERGSVDRRRRKKQGDKKGPEPKQKRYTVKEGDTLSGIAKKMYGDAERWRDIAKANNIRDPRRLKEGRVLRIP